MKRLISSVVAIALVAMTVVVAPADAAAITVSAASADVNTLAITLTGLTGNIDHAAGASSYNVKVRTLDDSTNIDISGATTIHGDNGTATVAAFQTTGATITTTGAAGTPSKVITITAAGLFPTTEDYFVTVEVVSGPQNVGDFGAATVIKSTQNQVSISATVEPVLTFAVTGTTVTFGTLNVSGDNAASASTTVSFVTNATSGITVSGVAVGADTGTTAGALGVAGSVDTIAGIGAETDPAAFSDSAEYFAVELQSLTANVGGIVAGNDFSNADNGTADRANDLADSTQLVSSNTNPVDGSFNVRYHVGIVPTTDAGTYTGTVTYTAAPTF